MSALRARASLDARTEMAVPCEIEQFWSMGALHADDRG